MKVKQINPLITLTTNRDGENLKKRIESGARDALHDNRVNRVGISKRELKGVAGSLDLWYGVGSCRISKRELKVGHAIAYKVLWEGRISKRELKEEPEQVWLKLLIKLEAESQKEN